MSLSNKIIELSDTPKFKNPPIVEMALGVQFKPLNNMRVTHFGSFFELLKPNGFLTVQELPPSPHQIEQKDPVINWPMLNISTAVQLPRVWFLSEESKQGQQVIQLQKDKLLQNWRSQNPENVEYTSYAVNRKNFQKTYELFANFVRDEHLGELKIDQCEVVYVDQIPLSDFNGPLDAYKKCFRGIADMEHLKHLSVDPDALGFHSHYWIDELNGRLYFQSSTASVNKKHAKREKIIDLRTTARGAPKDHSIESLMEWLDLAHYLSVNFFADVTSDFMHKKWGRSK